MCNKCEESMASSDDNEETSQVVGYPTDGQRKNVKVVNCINAFHSSIEKIANDQADLEKPPELANIKGMEDIGKWLPAISTKTHQ